MNIKAFFNDLQRAASLVWRADKRISSINIALQILQALLPIASLYYMKLLVEAVVHGTQSFDSVVSLIAFYGIIQFIIAAASQGASYISTKHQHKLTDNLSNDVLEKAIKVDYTYYENPAYHDTLHLAQQQAVFKASQLLNSFNSLLLNILSLIFLAGFFFTLHSLFAVIFIVVSIPLALIKWYSGFALLRLEKKFAPLEREANYLHQTLTGVNAAKEVRVFGYGNYFIQKFKSIRSLIQKEKTSLSARFTWYSLMAETGEIVAMSIIFGLLAKYTWQKTITVGAFVIYLQGFQRLQGSSRSFLQAVVQLFQQRLFLKDLFAFLDLKTDTAFTPQKLFPTIFKGLEIKNLSYTYTDSNKPALSQVSITCKPANIIAIVGENGSGKSTLVKLLARLYHAGAGSIEIDDTAINDIDITEFRNNTVFLFQDFEKYFLTVEENISLGNFDDELPAAIQNAARLANAHSFITNLSKGYKTRMGRLFKGSEQLSGGQWQKLALARAFYRKAELVILDEPTSALDANAEFEVFNNIKHHMHNQMVVLITHRLYNLKMADYIYVLKDGRLSQQGQFYNLINQEGEFKRMYDNQKL